MSSPGLNRGTTEATALPAPSASMNTSTCCADVDRCVDLVESVDHLSARVSTRSVLSPVSHFLPTT